MSQELLDKIALLEAESQKNTDVTTRLVAVVAELRDSHSDDPNVLAALDRITGTLTANDAALEQAAVDTTGTGETTA